jgi:hypothetical protein
LGAGEGGGALDLVGGVAALADGDLAVEIEGVARAGGRVGDGELAAFGRVGLGCCVVGGRTALGWGGVG